MKIVDFQVGQCWVSRIWRFHLHNKSAKTYRENLETIEIHQSIFDKLKIYLCQHLTNWKYIELTFKSVKNLRKVWKHILQKFKNPLGKFQTGETHRAHFKLFFEVLLEVLSAPGPFFSFPVKIVVQRLLLVNTVSEV